MTAPDAVLVGGGAIGLASAWRAARAGLAVTVVDPSPGRGASWVAAGMLAPVTEAHFGEERPDPALVAGGRPLAGLRRRPRGGRGLRIGYRRCGTVVVAADPSDRAVVDELLAFQPRLGLAAERLSASQCRRPGAGPGPGGARRGRRPRRPPGRQPPAAGGPARRLPGRRGDLVAGRGRRLELGAGGPGHRRGPGRRPAPRAGAVVVAAGRSGRPGRRARRRPAPGPPGQGPRAAPRGPARPRSSTAPSGAWSTAAPCYLVPRPDGSLVIGATAEERGFDRPCRPGRSTPSSTTPGRWSRASTSSSWWSA